MTPISNSKTIRIDWGKTYKNLPQLDLLAIQKDSYAQFLKDGIADLIKEISPVEDFTGKNWELTFGSYTLGKPKLTPDEAIRKRLTYDRPLKIETILLNKRTMRESRKQVFLGDIPEMTEVGTFIISGIERGVVNQITRSPGVFFSGQIDKISGRMLYQAEIRPLHGSWLEFMVNRNDVIHVRIDRRRKFPVTTLMRAFGISSDEQILAEFSKESKEVQSFVMSTLAEDGAKTKEEALIEIYQKMRPGEPIVLENAQAMMESMFFDNRRYDLGKVGRYKINRRLGLTLPETKENWILNKNDIIETVKFLIRLQNDQGDIEVDDIDNLANRRIRQVGELVGENAFRVGLLRLERSIKEKMSIFSTEERVNPIQLVNARPIIAAINEFFRSNQLSTVLDQTNPLSEVDNLRRLSVMGKGGVTRERASFSIRDINSSQYGKICPVRSPEGQNIGLVTYLSLYARINEYGFVEAPYLRVEKVEDNGVQRMRVTDEIVYVSAEDERNFYITHAGVNIDNKGFLTDSWVPVRHMGDFQETSVEKVNFIDVVPRQLVGVSASLIPFLANDMANRALMGTHMECQAVPLVRPQSPYVGTGMESVIASSMNRTVRARHNGEVIYVDAHKVVLKIKDKKAGLGNTESIKLNGQEETYYLSKFRRSNPNSTCYSQSPAVVVGQNIKEGDLLVNGPSCEEGELALGTNLVIAYSSYYGLEYEDAIVVSERLVKEDVLTSINIEEYETSLVETRLGPEELTRDIPNVSEPDLAHLGEDGVVVIGSEVGPNDILVGKIAPKGETELSPEERLLRAIFGEKAREVKDTSLRMPHGEQGTVIDVQILDRDEGDELEPGTIKKIIVRVAQLRKIKVGDKVAGRHGNKGVISKVVPEADMPYLADGTTIDIIISPLSVLSRMNLGQLLETHLGLAAKKLNYKVAIPAFEDINEDKIVEELQKAGFPADGKMTLYDGRTGEPHKNKSVVGVSYIMKLVHMVDDKTHARSTGPYSLITQQPLGGKAQMGGQRLGEMEVWALEAHRAAHVLQEMLTIKSDDVVGRAKAFEAIVKGTEIPEAMIPESFKVLVKELNSLALNIKMVETIEAHVVEEGEEDEKTN